MSNKKGFLTGLIFKSEDGGTTETEPKGTTTSAFKGNTNVQGVNVQNLSGTAMNVQGVIDNKFVDQLTSIIEQQNIPGQDYFEFKQAVENMKSMTTMNDAQKFQTIFAVLSLQGCTKAVLLSSLDKYISLIQSEKASFNTEMESQYQSRVTAKLAEAESAKKEMESLTKRMGELNTKILNVTQEAGAEEQKIRATEANFMASADVIINEMLGDKEKINNFINN
jgi:hypothetical protein